MAKQPGSSHIEGECALDLRLFEEYTASEFSDPSSGKAKFVKFESIGLVFDSQKNEYGHAMEFHFSDGSIRRLMLPLSLNLDILD